MKRVSTFLLIFLTMVTIFGALQAESVSVFGDYTSPGTVYGDLVVANGSIDVTSAGDLLVIGDVKVTNGFVAVRNGKLTVRGDLIVTNTTSSMANGNACIFVSSDLDVSGAIITESKFADAFVSTSMATGVNGTITAESIDTKGEGLSCIWSYTAANITGNVSASSASGDAYIFTGYNLSAGSITTTARNNASVTSLGSINVMGSLKVESTNSVGYVSAVSGIMAGGDLVTRAVDSAYVMNSVSGAIEVLGNIKTKSDIGTGYVINSNAYIYAGSISTDAYDAGHIIARGIDVTGDIVTKSLNDAASVYATADYILATNITTSAAESAMISAYHKMINVAHNISTFSKNSVAYVEIADPAFTGNIYAYNIVTNGYLDSSIRVANGAIYAGGSLNTKSSNGEAYISAAGTSEGITALEIFTNGLDNSYISSNGYVDVRDAISVKSTNGSAYVNAAGYLDARYIETNGNTSSYVSGASRITVECDVRTSSATSDAYVESSSGQIMARSIKTSAAAGFNGSVKSAIAPARFQLFYSSSDQAMTLKNTEFFLDKDHEYWKTVMSIEGSCTLNGNGHKIVLDGPGGFYIRSNSKLFLKNIMIDKIGANAIRGEDNTVTLSLLDVVLTQTANTSWANGHIQFSGICDIEGNGTQFAYDSTVASTINKNSTLLIGDGVSLIYNPVQTRNISMIDKSSRLHFNGGSLVANNNLALFKGTAVFDRDVLFDVASGKKIYFGHGVPADELDLEFHLRSRFSLIGTFTNVMP